jgi:hypothetical protein
MVSRLQLFSIYSFLHVLLDLHKNFHVGKELTKIVLFFVQIWNNVVYVNPCFLTLVGSKTNSSSDNPWEWRMLKFMQVHVQVLGFSSKLKLNYGCFLVGYID